MAFTPSRPPKDTPETRWMLAELKRLAQELEAQKEIVPYKELNVAPIRISNGNTIYADGSNYDPGKGEGIYGRVNGAWVLLSGVEDLNLVDNEQLNLGTGNDSYLVFDGTNLKIVTDVVAATDLLIDCGTNKTLKLVEPTYDDLPPVPIISTRLGANAPTLATLVDNVQAYTFDATNDYVIGSTEITHKYKEGTDIPAHIHYVTNGVDGTDRTVKYQLSFVVADANEAHGGTETVISGEDTIVASTADRTHQIVGIGTITGTNLKIGAYITWRFERIASSGTEPSADPFVLAVGFHIEQDTIGSRQLFTK